MLLLQNLLERSWQHKCKLAGRRVGRVLIKLAAGRPAGKSSSRRSAWPIKCAPLMLAAHHIISAPAKANHPRPTAIDQAHLLHARPTQIDCSTARPAPTSGRLLASRRAKVVNLTMPLGRPALSSTRRLGRSATMSHREERQQVGWSERDRAKMQKRRAAGRQTIGPCNVLHSRSCTIARARVAG